MDKKTFGYAFKSSLPVMAGYIFLGIAFGILLASKGYNWIWSFFSSLFVYAGSMQFVETELLQEGASIITGIFMTIMVNLRFMFYGLTMLEEYNAAGRKKAYLIFALTDETYSIVSSIQIPRSINRTNFYFYLSLLNHIYWVLGSVLGSFIGDVLPFNSRGIEFSMTCLFMVIFVEQWERTKNHLAQIIGGIISILSLLIFGKEKFLLPTIFLITIVMFLIRPFLEKEWRKDYE